eukprot:2035144-Rhodomonas_salina.5
MRTFWPAPRAPRLRISDATKQAARNESTPAAPDEARGVRGQVWRVAWTPLQGSEQMLLSASLDGTISGWDIRCGVRAPPSKQFPPTRRVSPQVFASCRLGWEGLTGDATVGDGDALQREATGPDIRASQGQSARFARLPSGSDDDRSR